MNNILIQLTEHNIGISTPNKSFGVLPKFPLVSTTWGKISCGNLSKFIMELDQHLMNGSKIPVADALEISVTCFPVQKYRLLILCSSRFLKNSVLINKEIDVQKCRLRLIYQIKVWIGRSEIQDSVLVSALYLHLPSFNINFNYNLTNKSRYSWISTFISSKIFIIT